MSWAFIQAAIDMYSPGYGRTHFGPVGGVFIMGIGLLALGIPVAVLCIIGERGAFRGEWRRGRLGGFFQGKTLNGATEITGLDHGPESHPPIPAGDLVDDAGRGGWPGWPHRIHRGVMTRE